MLGYIFHLQLVKTKTILLVLCLFITNRFIKHFDNIIVLRKKLEEAIKVTEDFGRDARSIKNVLESIKNRDENEDNDDDPDPKAPMSSFGTVEKRKVS